jgi:hypothetical protein
MSLKSGGVFSAFSHATQEEQEIPVPKVTAALSVPLEMVETAREAQTRSFEQTVLEQQLEAQTVSTASWAASRVVTAAQPVHPP